jgi:hypothetical protein
MGLMTIMLVFALLAAVCIAATVLVVSRLASAPRRTVGHMQRTPAGSAAYGSAAYWASDDGVSAGVLATVSESSDDGCEDSDGGEADGDVGACDSGDGGGGDGGGGGD